ncbi:hypothetical protein [Clostridium novyi]|uniref:Conserved protein n=1 Tax=Clostridium novyi (strain NT) TaxID=386415 RepID=A0Q045_CLONN|nr:hypothetical protein [Clostridium novyi]ABK60692.1 conserved protein [Clostridium novyi NT]KEH86053.1 hypothetical protein Z966_04420 [Clostridium novyi A str. NCTC 538]
MGTAFVLLIIGICLIFLNIRGLNKEKNSFENVLNKEKVNMDDVKLEIGSLRKEFAETLLEVQREIVAIKEKLDMEENLHTNDDESYKEKTIYDDKIENIKDIVDIDFNKEVVEDKKENKLRIKEVRDLINKGLSIEEIADVLKVGKGEILLIKELYLK